MKGSSNNGTKQGSGSVLSGFEGDLFDDAEQDAVPLTFSDINADALRDTIAAICNAGGYIGFSSAPGARAIKVSGSVGKSTGQRWCQSEQQLSAAVLTLWKHVKREKQ